MLAKLPDETVVYPGHNYAEASSTTIGAEKRNNPFFQPKSAEEFLRMLGVRR